MNPLYHQLLGVIAVILTLGALGIFRALEEREERLDREQGSFPAAVERLAREEALRLAREIRRLRSGAEVEDPAQHRVGHE
jgi:hypothetical protein